MACYALMVYYFPIHEFLYYLRHLRICQSILYSLNKYDSQQQAHLNAYCSLDRKYWNNICNQNIYKHYLHLDHFLYKYIYCNKHRNSLHLK